MNAHLSKVSFLTCIALLCATPGTQAADEVTVAADELTSIGQKVFNNECGGDPEKLIWWNEGEQFASLGIGHFIWYPTGQTDPFEESFPALLTFLKTEGSILPEWIEQLSPLDCPWTDRDDLLKNSHDPRLISLREFLQSTISLQTTFLLERLKNALPLILASVPTAQRRHIENQFWRVAKSPGGWYPLIDYVNFKGDGTNDSERYQGYGWGLVQVLQEMTGKEIGSIALQEFSESANLVLTRRVQNAPPGRNEQRWLTGWRKRVASYAS